MHVESLKNVPFFWEGGGVLNKTGTKHFSFHDEQKKKKNLKQTESDLLLLQAVRITQTEINSELYVCSVG